ncbi:LytTR family DNA-binding domain-containing protein [Emticicia sp. C21]|uniref:LytR/AlgR family response regulator transcription factor n=1 Tax=Emticicia sp. C21 TaxID=2302915 RepID=UPI0013141AD6|nr:LytTR family DNA-binding domain-containing protein [Emticicia sp. C21]
MTLIQKENLRFLCDLQESLRLNNKNRINTDDIVYLQSDWNYTHVHTIDNRKILSSFTLKILEKRIFDKDFIRINRGSLVNIRRISTIKDNGKVGEATMYNGSVLPISRRKLNTVKRVFESSASVVLR